MKFRSSLRIVSVVTRSKMFWHALNQQRDQTCGVFSSRDRAFAQKISEKFVFLFLSLCPHNRSPNHRLRWQPAFSGGARVVLWLLRQGVSKSASSSLGAFRNTQGKRRDYHMIMAHRTQSVYAHEGDSVERVFSCGHPKVWKWVFLIVSMFSFSQSKFLA